MRKTFSKKYILISKKTFVLFLVVVSFLLISSRADALIRIVSTFIDMLGNDIYNVGNLNATGNIVTTGDVNASDLISSNWVNATNYFLGNKILFNLSTTDPAVPPAGQGYLYGKLVSGRSFPKWEGPTGVNFPLQPSFFQNFIVMIQTNITTITSSIGDSTTRTGTTSHPAATQTYGYMSNFVTAATAGATAGVSQATTTFVRGNAAGANGFFFNARIGLPDAAYKNASAGCRIFVGMTNETLALAVGSDNPRGHYAGFQWTDSRADNNFWYFMAKDGTTQNLTNTTMPFIVQHVYDMFVYCSPQCAEIDWRIDDITAGTTSEGTATSNLPGATIYLRGGLQVAIINAQPAHNIRMQRVYIESDR